MLVDATKYQQITDELKDITLVAVSKAKSIEAINKLYELGHRDFGENYVQELVEKQTHLPKDIRWHFIGHLQSNKVKQIVPFIHLIQSVDSLKVLKEIEKQAKKHNRVINILLQVHIAREESKFGLDENELHELLNTNLNELDKLRNITIKGLMGIASFSENIELVRKEFRMLKEIFDQYNQQPTTNYKLESLSIGMSNDYKVAVEEGSNMVRIGSLIFGNR